MRLGPPTERQNHGRQNHGRFDCFGSATSSFFPMILPSMILPFVAVLLLTSLAFSQSRPAPDGQPFQPPGPNPTPDYDRELLGGSREKTAQPKSGEADRMEEQLRRELGGAAEKGADSPEDDEKPLQAVERNMRQVQTAIAKQDSGPDVQQVQQRIIDQLQRMIAQARKSAQPSGPAKKPGVAQPKPNGIANTPGSPKPDGKDGNNPRSPNTNPPPTKPELAPSRRDLEQSAWLRLPERQRERMLQLPREVFLPKYELLIEDYFRRLANDQPDSEDRP